MTDAKRFPEPGRRLEAWPIDRPTDDELRDLIAFWLPDWRNAANCYPLPTASRRTFAWQFARRSLDYVASWESLRPARGVMSERDIADLAAREAERFGLRALADPASDHEPEFLAAEVHFVTESWFVEHEPSEVAPILDLEQPVTPQLESIGAWAREQQRYWRARFGAKTNESERIPTDSRRLIDALRAHDAIFIGTRQVNVAAALFPRIDADAARQRLVRLHAMALRFVGGGYRVLAAADRHPGVAPPDSQRAAAMYG